VLPTTVENHVLSFVYRATVIATYSSNLSDLMGHKKVVSKGKAQFVKPFDIARRASFGFLAVKFSYVGLV